MAKNATQNEAVSAFKLVFKWVFFTAIILTIVFGTFYVVPAGSRAVLLTFGKPSMQAVGEGLNFKVPLIQEAVKMDIKTQKYEADLTAASKDLQDVKTKIAINYHIDGDSAPVIYREIGLNYAEKVIYPLEQEINKAATAQFTAEELITKRDAVREIMKNTLMEKLRTRGIIVEEISIINFEFSKSFSESIEAKVVMEQSALTAKNKLEQVKYEAEQKIAAAQGEAKAIQIRGEALKNNPGVIELNWIEKWDGHQPMVVGGATPLINLPANL